MRREGGQKLRAHSRSSSKAFGPGGTSPRGGPLRLSSLHLGIRPDGDRRRLGPRVDAQLLQNVADVRLYRCELDLQPPRDLFVGEALPDQAEDLALALGQRRARALPAGRVEGGTSRPFVAARSMMVTSCSIDVLCVA